MNKQKKKISLTEHLEELRIRLIFCITSITISFSMSYMLKNKILSVLTAPLIFSMGQNKSLIYTNLPEAFFTYLKISFISGITISFPLITYQFWKFIVPGLYDNEKKTIYYLLVFSSFFFIIGTGFGYLIVFPIGFNFFLGFSSEIIQPLPCIKEYLNFSIKLLLAFGMVFEIPLVLVFLTKLNIISIRFLKKNRKFAILIFFIGSAAITPPDIITQIMMALPLILLYEISILGARFFSKKLVP